MLLTNSSAPQCPFVPASTNDPSARTRQMEEGDGEEDEADQDPEDVGVTSAR